MENQFNFNNELKDKIALVTGGTKGVGFLVSPRGSYLTGTEYLIDGGTIPTI